METKKRKEQKNSDVTLVKEKTSSFFKERKNANDLLDIIAHFQSENDQVVLACIRSVHKIFSSLISQEEMMLAKIPQSEEDYQDFNAAEKYKVWLRERYDEIQNWLVSLLVHPTSNIQELSLCTLMKLVEKEGEVPLRKMKSGQLFFPTPFYEKVIRQLCDDNDDQEGLINRFQEYMEFDDVRYYSMKFIQKELKAKSDRLNTDDSVYLNNIYSLLCNLSMPPPPEGDTLSKFIAKAPDANTHLKINTHKEHKKLFTSVWLEFLKCKLPTSLYKKVLVNLTDKVIPHMTSPLLLADFLTASYNIGGAISLLALNGIFVLVNSFNLDYPDFYEKLYALLQPSLFHVKYRARFFFLADLFLTSTHLPSYLVAAFAKKLARLCLAAPPSGLSIVMAMIHNLISRHPSCQVLVHRPDGPTDVTSDPFNMDEPNPNKCNAMESSLWELKTLQQHYHHTIAKEAAKLDEFLPKEEKELGDLLEVSVSDMITNETKKKMKTIPTTYECPKGLFSNKEDTFKSLWTLE